MLATNQHYTTNTRRWHKGDLVLHRADAKQPYMMLEIMGYRRDGLVKCRYFALPRHLQKRQRIYHLPLAELLDPETFGIATEITPTEKMFVLSCGLIWNSWQSARTDNRLEYSKLSRETQLARLEDFLEVERGLHRAYQSKKIATLKKYQRLFANIAVAIRAANASGMVFTYAEIESLVITQRN